MLQISIVRFVIALIVIVTYRSLFDRRLIFPFHQCGDCSNEDRLAFVVNLLTESCFWLAFVQRVVVFCWFTFNRRYIWFTSIIAYWLVYALWWCSMRSCCYRPNLCYWLIIDSVCHALCFKMSVVCICSPPKEAALSFALATNFTIYSHDLIHMISCQRSNTQWHRWIGHERVLSTVIESK